MYRLGYIYLYMLYTLWYVWGWSVLLEEDSERLYNMFGVLCHPLSSISMGQIIIWLVVEASEKSESQLGWWKSRYISGKRRNVPNHQPDTQYIEIGLYQYHYRLGYIWYTVYVCTVLFLLFLGRFWSEYLDRATGIFFGDFTHQNPWYGWSFLASPIKIGRCVSKMVPTFLGDCCNRMCSLLGRNLWHAWCHAHWSSQKIPMNCDKLQDWESSFYRQMHLNVIKCPERIWSMSDYASGQMSEHMGESMSAYMSGYTYIHTYIHTYVYIYIYRPHHFRQDGFICFYCDGGAHWAPQWQLHQQVSMQISWSSLAALASLLSRCKLLDLRE